MRNRITYIITVLSMLACLDSFAQAVPAAAFQQNMPGSRDFIFKYWKNGYVNTVNQPVLNVFTGWYGFSFNVMNFSFNHLNTDPGKVDKDGPFAESYISQGKPAVLKISFTANGKQYELLPVTCAIDTAIKLLEDGAWLTRYTWPLVEFGNAGSKWKGRASLELSAWPGKFIFAIRFRDAEATAISNISIAIERDGRPVSNAPVASTNGKDRIVAAAVIADKNSAAAGDISVKAQLKEQQLVTRWDMATDRWVVEMPAKGEVPEGTKRPYPSMQDFKETIAFTIQNPAAKTATASIAIEKIIQERLRNIDIKNALPITGLCFVVYDDKGQLTGLPIQVSKNWHTVQRIYHDEGHWYRGSLFLRVPALSSVRFSVQIVRGNWGNITASTLAQLCLIGWPGKYSLDWHQVAIGNMGESITYSPEGLLGSALICDWRALYTPGRNGELYDWTANLGGGDWLVYHDEKGERQRIKQVLAIFDSYGPLLSGISYTGITPDQKIRATIKAITPAANDLNRTLFKIRYDVLADVKFSRLAFFQMGADQYNWHKAKSLAAGNHIGKEFSFATDVTQQKENSYLGKAVDITTVPAWIAFTGSYPEREMDLTNKWTWANRGFIIREWNARLNGSDRRGAAINSFVTFSGKVKSNNAELVTPANTSQLKTGDFIEFTIEGIIPPRVAEEYYGKDSFLIRQLQQYPDSWELLHAYTVKGQVQIISGKEMVRSVYPLEIKCTGDKATVVFSSGKGDVPVQFTGLSSYTGYRVIVEQGDHRYETGTKTPEDLQVIFDTRSQAWSLVTFLKVSNEGPVTVSLVKE